MAMSHSNERETDLSLIDLDDAAEVRYWMDELGCSEEQLRTAVRAAGSSAADVREYLQTKP